MNKGATPHNYNLRNRIATQLLRPSDFTPPNYATLTPEATAPLLPHDNRLIPSTSLLLDGAAAIYTSPVTIYPPLTTSQTISTSSTSTLTTPTIAPAIQPTSDSDSTNLTTPTTTPVLVTQRPAECTTTSFGSPSHLDSLLDTVSPVLVTPKSTLFTANSLDFTPTLPTVLKDRTLTAQPSNTGHVTLTPPEYYSRSGTIFGNRFSETGMGGMWIWVIGLLLLTLNPGSAVDEQRLNYGVIFQSLSPVYCSADKWIHTFQIQLPENISVEPIEYCVKNVRCNFKNALLQQLNAIRITMNAQFNSTISLINELIPESVFQSSNVSKRAILPFIGEIGKNLFGLATTGDVATLASHINMLTRQNNKILGALARHGGDFSSYISQVDNRFNNMLKAIGRNSQTLLLLEEAMGENEENIRQQYQKSEEVIAAQMLESQQIRHELEKLQLATVELAAGKLPAVLIPPHVLAESINQIETIISTDYPGYSITPKDPRYYYQFGSFIATRKDRDLYIALQIPISSRQRPFETYRIQSFPVPINASSAHVTQLLDLPDIMLVSDDHQFYTTLALSSLNQCTGKDILHCNIRPTLKPLSQPECVNSLFLDDKANIHQTCNFRFMTNRVVPHILDISSNQILVYLIDEIILECQNQRRVIKGCSFCIMNIRCHCAVVTTSMTYDGHITTCTDNSTEVTQLHPINLALLQQFFNSTHLAAILGNTSFDNPLTISLPEFKLYEHQMSQFFATDKEIDLNLKKVAARAKTDQKIFSSLAETMLSGEISIDNDSWFDSLHIMTIISFSLSILNTLAIVWLIWRFRALSTALLLAHTTKAQSTVHFQYTIAPTTSSPDWFTAVSDVLTWDHWIFSVSIMTFVIALVQVYKWISQSNARTKLRLEITTGVQCVMVDILQLSLCPSYWNITGPSMIDNLHVTGYLRPRLHVTWTGFKLTKVNSNAELTMPTSFSIDIVSAYKLRSIFSQPFCAHVIWTHHDIAFPQRSDGSISECSPQSHPLLPPYTILP